MVLDILDTDVDFNQFNTDSKVVNLYTQLRSGGYSLFKNLSHLDYLQKITDNLISYTPLNVIDKEYNLFCGKYVFDQLTENLIDFYSLSDIVKNMSTNILTCNRDNITFNFLLREDLPINMAVCVSLNGGVNVKLVKEGNLQGYWLIDRSNSLLFLFESKHITKCIKDLDFIKCCKVKK